MADPEAVNFDTEAEVDDGGITIEEDSVLEVEDPGTRTEEDSEEAEDATLLEDDNTTELEELASL